MAEHDDNPLSPTMTKVLDEYLDALRSDADLSNEMAERLYDLLRKGKVPKLDDIDAALFPPAAKDKI